MKKIVSFLLAALLIASVVTGAMALTDDEAKKAAEAVVNTTTDSSEIVTPFISVVKDVRQSVVGVNNYQKYTYSSYDPFYGFGDFFGFDFGFGDYNGGGRNGGGRNSTPKESVEQLAATGSGVVVYDGVVLTNYHVVEDASRLTISTLDSDKEFEGTLITYDEAADVAVIYVPDLDLPAVPLGDSDQLQVGEWTICIGNPLSDVLKGTVTVGIVSALDRQIDSTTTTDKYGLKRTVTNSMIQTNAAINSGNSGGGMFNVLGQMMGIPSAKYSGSYYSGTTIEGIGLAIPINTAKPLIEEAIIKVLSGKVSAPSNKDSGSVASVSSDKPALGITIQSITSSNNYMVYAGQLPSGLLVSEVNAGSPAEVGGLQPYDIIVEVEDQLMDSNTRLRQILDDSNFGDTLQVKVYRVEGLKDAESASDLGHGEYIDLEIELFEYNIAA